MGTRTRWVWWGSSKGTEARVSHEMNRRHRQRSRFRAQLDRGREGKGDVKDDNFLADTQKAEMPTPP